MKTNSLVKKLTMPLLFLAVIVLLSLVLPGESVMLVLVGVGFIAFGWFIYRVLTKLKGRESKNNFAEAKKQWESINVIVPEFLTGIARDKYIKTKREEEIEKIDPSRDRDYKVTFFQSWKQEREKNGKPLTALEENFYRGLHQKEESTNVWTVILPGVVTMTLIRNGFPFFYSLGIGLIIAAFIRSVGWFFESRK